MRNRQNVFGPPAPACRGRSSSPAHRPETGERPPPRGESASPPPGPRASCRRGGGNRGRIPALCLMGLCLLPQPAAAQADVPGPTPPNAAAGASAGPEQARTLERMEAVYAKLATYRAAFRQESDTRSLRRRKESAGELFFQKPDRMRWIYRTPEKRDIYIDENQMLLYMPEQNTAMRQPLGDALAGAAPARLFLGPKALAETFRISTVDPGADAPETLCLELTPREKGRMSVEQILLWVGKEDYLPRRTRSRDIMGNVTTIDFLQGETNVKLDPELFRFEPPPGVEIVENVY